jgi:predicted RNase H-like HicB family nuclease/uncharacterized damage-inducible protein DinB
VTEYALYLESGPKHKKTMVHVLDLLGCIAQGPTTEAALEAAPEAIRAWLRFLKRHGEDADPRDKFTTRVAIHVTEGVWLGYGDPTSGFAPDFEPLTTENLQIYVRHLAWMQDDLMELVRDLPLSQLLDEPESGGRSIYHILEHVAESQAVYLRYLVGKMDSLSETLRAVQKGPVEILLPALTDLWQVCRARMDALTEAERRQSVLHGQVTWTACRAFRRMLEHTWEHLMEVSVRLNSTL